VPLSFVPKARKQTYREADTTIAKQPAKTGSITGT